jgi:hypothetical protein
MRAAAQDGMERDGSRVQPPQEAISFRLHYTPGFCGWEWVDAVAVPVAICAITGFQLEYRHAQRIHRDPRTGRTLVRLYCAELPGANGQGHTQAESLANLREAIALILEHRREESLRDLPPDATQENCDC